MRVLRGMSTLLGTALILVGCGGGGSSTPTTQSTTNSNSNSTATTTDKKLKGYYVDDPIVNISYKCGKYSNKTGDEGEFYFEQGKGCEFSIAGVKLTTVPASVLKDGIYIVEINPNITSFLQSIDSSEDTEQKIFVDKSTIEELKSLGLSSIPEDNSELKSLIEELNDKLKSKAIKLSLKTKDEAQKRVKDNLEKEYKNKEHILTSKIDELVSANGDTQAKGNKPTNGNQTNGDTQVKGNKPTNGEALSKKAKPIPPEKVDEGVNQTFGEDKTEEKISQDDMKALVGNWAGEANYIKINLQLRKDGTYKYHSQLGIGKYHNYYRYSDYEGSWKLDKGNSQIVLSLPNVDAPLVLTNKFPKIETPAGVTLSAGSDIDTSYQMSIDQSQNIVTAKYSDKAKEYMNRTIADFQVDYFTMVAPKVNSEQFWSSIGILPAGYHYGHKLGLDSDDWKYAMERIKDDPKNYVMVISDENWQTLIGHRKSYIKDIQKPEKVYKWLEYFKDQMQILGKVPGTVLYIIAGDAPPYWTSDIRLNHNNDAKTISGKIIESRFPEVLERNPSNSWAGIFQMMDYLRMKYAPNVKLSYTLKTWGIAEKDIYHEPAEGWDSKDTVKVMADTINSLDANFDMLSFNFHPRSQHQMKEYEDGARYFGAISKLLKTRGGNEPKLWIWKISLWNKEQPKFFFTHIDFLVNECNAIGMTLGHGNDLTKLSGFKDDPDNGIYVKSWMEEYYNATEIDSIPVHATKGLVHWR